MEQSVGRYKITATRDGRKFGILDLELYDYCALVDDQGGVKPLEWYTKHGAQAWLNRCFVTWLEWDRTGEGQTPRNWRPRRPQISPFDPGIQYYN